VNEQIEKKPKPAWRCWPVDPAIVVHDGKGTVFAS
jgi:hypothetical protein